MKTAHSPRRSSRRSAPSLPDLSGFVFMDPADPASWCGHVHGDIRDVHRCSILMAIEADADCARGDERKQEAWESRKLVVGGTKNGAVWCDAASAEECQAYLCAFLERHGIDCDTEWSVEYAVFSHELQEYPSSKACAEPWGRRPLLVAATKGDKPSSHAGYIAPNSRVRGVPAGLVCGFVVVNGPPFEPLDGHFPDDQHWCGHVHGDLREGQACWSEHINLSDDDHNCHPRLCIGGTLDGLLWYQAGSHKECDAYITAYQERLTDDIDVGSLGRVAGQKESLRRYAADIARHPGPSVNVDPRAEKSGAQTSGAVKSIPVSRPVAQHIAHAA